MKCSGPHLLTPVYLKLKDDMPWPEGEKAFYVISSNGLFLCRDTPFFRSCVPVDDFPSELAGQEPFLKLNYPRVPRVLLEQVIGFFDLIGTRHSSEAAVLIVWNRTTAAVEIVVPEQVGIVGTSSYGYSYPIQLAYEVPALAPNLVLLGDIHSHVDGAAYASSLDEADEVHRPGLHLVVGRISDEPPQFHCEACADGCRFKIHDLSQVLEGYKRRRVHAVPAEWLDKVRVQPWSSQYRWVQCEKANVPAVGNGSSSMTSPAGAQATPPNSVEPPSRPRSPES